ncbi:MAG: hypothetical protein IT435_07005 [Phycisphaerales bacterium]|nr:hypothetical protein [Phycisphaerales bacterium]
MKRLINSVLGRSGVLAMRAGRSDVSRSRNFEPMEPRKLLATFQVLNLSDAGVGSLRQAIADANAAGGADVIEFNPDLSGTLSLTTGQIVVSDSITMEGPGASQLSISGSDSSRVLRFTGGTSALSGLTITGGNDFSGGGISNTSILTLTDMVITGNTVNAGGGAGLENSGTLTLTNSTISGNDGGIGDGGGIRNDGTMTITGSTISGNTAVNGGGILHFGPAMTISNSTISGNSASIGGAAIINFNVLTVKNSTMSGNTAATMVTNSGTLTLTSVIIAGTAGNDMVGTFDAASANNLIQDSGSAGGLTDGVNGNMIGNDPLLGALGSNGGSTQTHALLAGSPAINAGSNPDTLTTDQRGGVFSRVFGNGIDIGAFEFSAPPTIASLSPSAQSVLRGGTISLGAISVADSDGTIAIVNFYRDADDDGIAEPSELIGSDDDGGNGYSFDYDVPTDIPAGETKFMAIALDNDGDRSQPVSADVVITNILPTLVSVTVSGPSFLRGQTLTLTANSPADTDGTIAQVDFYWDADDDGVADAGELIGNDSNATGGYTFAYTIPNEIPAGTAIFLAVAVDNDAGASPTRSTEALITNTVPTLGGVTPSAGYVARGQNITLTATAPADSDGTVVRVDFFLDADDDGVADAGELIGSDNDAAGGHTFTFSVPAEQAMGDTEFLAVAVDNDGGVSGVALTSVGILSSSQFASAIGQQLGASAGSTGNLNITTQNPSGAPMVMQQAGGATTWTGSDLQAKTGSPAIIGEVVSWVDPKDGRNYAAAMSAEGLILFTNTGTAAWTFRNLSTEIPGTPVITGNLTVFTATNQIVSIAGVAASGDLIRYFQTGTATGSDFVWSAVNHGDDLRDQGLTVPQFTGRITSFVTSWNALNVVGLDANGDIQAVWWHSSLATDGKWTTNNLSDEYGAPPLTGGLTVWLTSWNAINIAGTDLDGKLSATWWVPEFNNNQWNNSNLTDDFAGPLLEPDSMTSWVTPWGAMNIAGREADGTTSVYWWVPNFNNNQWNIASFRDILPTATETTGPVTGLTAPGGDFSMSILGTSEIGEVIRYWWTPTTNVWAEQNVTQDTTAV